MENYRIYVLSLAVTKRKAKENPESNEIPTRYHAISVCIRAGLTD